MLKRFLLVFVVLGAGAVLFSTTVLLLIPSELIMGSVKQRLQAGPGLILTEQSAERVFPFGIKARGLLLSTSDRGGKDLLYLDTLSARLSLLSILSGGVKAEFNATTARGSLKGYVLLKINRTEVDIEVKDIDLDVVPAFLNAGLEGGGSFDGRLELTFPSSTCPEGTLRAKGFGMDPDALGIMGFRLPFGRITDAGLRAELKDCRASIRALWIDGSNMSARVSGLVTLVKPVQQSRLALDIEVIPRKGAAEKPGLLLLLGPYRRSANYYSMKVSGTLGSPVLGP